MDVSYGPQALRLLKLGYAPDRIVKLIHDSDPDPNPVLAWLTYDHPPIRERLALADEPLPPVSHSGG